MYAHTKISNLYTFQNSFHKLLTNFSSAYCKGVELWLKKKKSLVQYVQTFLKFLTIGICFKFSVSLIGIV